MTQAIIYRNNGYPPREVTYNEALDLLTYVPLTYLVPAARTLYIRDDTTIDDPEHKAALATVFKEHGIGLSAPSILFTDRYKTLMPNIIRSDNPVQRGKVTTLAKLAQEATPGLKPVPVPKPKKPTMRTQKKKATTNEKTISRSITLARSMDKVVNITKPIIRNIKVDPAKTSLTLLTSLPLAFNPKDADRADIAKRLLEGLDAQDLEALLSDPGDLALLFPRELRARFVADAKADLGEEDEPTEEFEPVKLPSPPRYSE
jgi:hypothetical protein